MDDFSEKTHRFQQFSWPWKRPPAALSVAASALHKALWIPARSAQTKVPRTPWLPFLEGSSQIWLTMIDYSKPAEVVGRQIWGEPPRGVNFLVKNQKDKSEAHGVWLSMWLNTWRSSETCSTWHQKQFLQYHLFGGFLKWRYPNMDGE